MVDVDSIFLVFQVEHLALDGWWMGAFAASVAAGGRSGAEQLIGRGFAKELMRGPDITDEMDFMKLHRHFGYSLQISVWRRVADIFSDISLSCSELLQAVTTDFMHGATARLSAGASRGAALLTDRRAACMTAAQFYQVCMYVSDFQDDRRYSYDAGCSFAERSTSVEGEGNLDFGPGITVREVHCVGL